jgi:hypothetical protein
MGKPVGMGMAEDVPSSTRGTELVTTPGVERRARNGSQAMNLGVKIKSHITVHNISFTYSFEL